MVGRRTARVQGLVRGTPFSLQCRRSRVFTGLKDIPFRKMDPELSFGDWVPDRFESGAVPLVERRLLDHIAGHEELRELPSCLLPQLAREIRSKLHETISRIPGHYASN